MATFLQIMGATAIAVEALSDLAVDENSHFSPNEIEGVKAIEVGFLRAACMHGKKSDEEIIKRLSVAASDAKKHLPKPGQFFESESPKLAAIRKLHDLSFHLTAHQPEPQEV